MTNVIDRPLAEWPLLMFCLPNEVCSCIDELCKGTAIRRVLVRQALNGKTGKVRGSSTRVYPLLAAREPLYDSVPQKKPSAV